MADWSKTVKGDEPAAKAVTDMAAMCKYATLLDAETMTRQGNLETFRLERKPSYEEITAHSNEPRAFVRLQIDPRKVKGDTPKQQDMSFRKAVEALDDFILKYIGKEEASSYLSYLIVNGRNGNPVAYIDFSGKEAQTDATLLTKIITTAMTPGRGGGRG